jgi:hypothetical protein
MIPQTPVGLAFMLFLASAGMYVLVAVGLTPSWWAFAAFPLWIASAVAIYLLPVAVANDRKHPNRTAILALTLTGGWTYIGWVAALTWAYTNQDAPR